jgi:hypothetical protein
MYGAIVLVILLFLIVYGIGNCINSEKVLRVAVYFLKDVAFALVFISVNNMGFSFGLQCRYLLIGQVWDTPMYVSWAFAIFSIILFIIYLIIYGKSTNQEYEGYH